MDNRAGNKAGKWFPESQRVEFLTLSKGPTVFPILFAALVGRSLKAVGRYRAERGVRVSVSIIVCYYSHGLLIRCRSSGRS